MVHALFCHFMNKTETPVFRDCGGIGKNACVKTSLTRIQYGLL